MVSLQKRDTLVLKIIVVVWRNHYCTLNGHMDDAFGRGTFLFVLLKQENKTKTL